MTQQNFIRPEFQDHMDPVTYYNTYKLDHAITVFNTHHRKSNKQPALFIKNEQTACGSVTITANVFNIGQHDRINKLPHNTQLTPFQVFCILEHDKNFSAATAHVEMEFMERTNPYVRVGVDYFKIIKKPDRFGIARTELKRWKKDELTTDYGKDFLRTVKKFDDFTIVPDNINYQPIIESGQYIFRNLYNPFEHKPAEGRFTWSRRLMKHVFGNQLKQGYQYMQCLYLYPKQILPILVLVSRDRSTGKTTFINWLNQIFGANMMQINPEDVTSSFNGIYSRSNIIAIEEAFFEKDTIVEKLKSITTAKYMSVNQKYIDNYKIPFFGKVIIASNKVENFARIDEQEIRFWIRELPTITTENAKIEEDLVDEIPAFLHHLTTLPQLDFTQSRMLFKPKELHNENLRAIMKESKPGLYKELILNIQDYFDNNDANELKMTPKDIKNIWFDRVNNYNQHYISVVLRDHFQLKPLEKPAKYYTIRDEYKAGRYYTFSRKAFTAYDPEQYSTVDDKHDSYNPKLFMESNEDLPF
jgi:hypothetical protein